jgi:hypothetical protein
LPYINRLITFMACLLGIGSPFASAASPEVVEKSLAKAREWLYKQQNDGHWDKISEAPKPPIKEVREIDGGQFTGATALAVLALVNSGENPQDPRIKSAVDFLLKNQTTGTYALGIRCQVWLALPATPQTRQAMLNDVKLLLTGFRRDGNARGMYDYIASAESKSYSHSRSQYAVLGVWAAAQMGIEISDDYWKLVEDAWKRNQDPSGGWNYTHPGDNKRNLPVTPGMTTVGVASLFITQEQLRAGEGINCRDSGGNVAIEKGLKWLGANMDKFATDTKYDRDWPLPTLYAYERVGAASGLRYIGGVDWYEKGSDWVIKKQHSTGSWSTSGVPTVAATSFGMLFLAKGRAPIIFNKLQYVDAATGKDGKWDQRPRDVANVTRWIGRTIERELAFQITNLDADLADIAAAPITIITGSEALNLSDKHVDKLKAYIEAGGMVLASADCGQAAFAQSVKTLGTKMFPDYEFRTLPENDIVYTEYYPRSKWRTKPAVEALSNGVRKLIVLVPSGDPGKVWQLQDHRSRTENFELAANLLLHAVDRSGLRYRGDQSAYLPDDPKLKAKTTITVGRIKYPAAWDPEPGGWRRMNNLLLKKQETAVVTKVVELGKGELGQVKIAHLTGTTATKFTDAHRDELRKFVEGGGTLLVDAAGGSSDFASAIESELAAIFPKTPLTLLPAPMFTPGGTVEYRSFARKAIGRINTPRLQGIVLNGRAGVIYSREDLSHGLVGHPVDGVVGYTPETSTTLVSAILTQAAVNKLTVPTEAASAATTKPAEVKK